MWLALYSLPLLAGHELVVFGLDFSVGHGVVLLVVGEQFADQDGLAGQFHLRFVVGRSFQAALLGFLHEDFAGDHFFLDLTFHFRGDGAAGALYLLAQNFGALFGHGLAIHDGKVLGGYGQGHRAQHGSGHEAGQELFLHANPKSEKVITGRRPATVKMGAGSENFNGDGVNALVNKFLQRIIHKAMLRNAASSCKQR
jgi:hypothetical protein